VTASLGSPAPSSPVTTAPHGADNLVAALLEEAHRAAAAGRREVARQRYESALYLLRAPAESSLASMIMRRIGRTYLDDGDFAAGMDCLDGALAIAEANENPGEIAHTINVMAISFWQRGSLEEAIQLYGEAASMARIANDERLLAMIDQNLGVVASMRGDVPTALRHHASSLDRYRALGLQEDIARQLSNLGLAYQGLGRYGDADAAYAEALAISHDRGDTWTRLMVEVNRVALLIAQWDFGAARDVCDRILLEAGAIKETRLLAETYKHCGVIARETGSLTEADGYLRMAYEQALKREDLLLAAETAREQAELFLELGRNRETLQSLSTSHRLFTQLRAKRELTDVSLRLRRLEHRFHDLVQKWAQGIESKDAYTLGHCERVADLACAIANDMGFDETTMFWFRVGALLHDVGKIVVPPEILNKAGPLTPEERRIMESHPEAGVELLRDVEFPWDVSPMIRGHHERWDGHGYPERLAGDAIPLTARILCVADVYDALTTDRPYRKAFEVADALKLMEADSGRAFDPAILERFVRIIRADKQRISGPTRLRLVV
jgi:putative nucleotidyltransferase with HDIG domain